MEYYDDCYELFGDEIGLAVAQDKLSFLDELGECKHTRTKLFEDGTGYCVECGKSVTVSEKDEICAHESMYEDDYGMKICSKCKREFEHMTYEQEWKYYPDSSFDGKDPSRCHKTRVTEKTLMDVFANIGWQPKPAIIANVEKRYNQIVKGDTTRGKKRRAIVAVCVFFVMYEFGECRTSDYLRDKFNLSKKDMSDGFTAYHETFPESRTLDIKPVDLLKWIMSLVEIPLEPHYRKIHILAEYFSEASVPMKRSSPQSVASAIIYFYLCLNPELKTQLKLSKNKFAEKVKLSDITITKLVNEASRISKVIIEM